MWAAVVSKTRGGFSILLFWEWEMFTPKQEQNVLSRFLQPQHLNPAAPWTSSADSQGVHLNNVGYWPMRDLCGNIQWLFLSWNNKNDPWRVFLKSHILRPSYQKGEKGLLAVPGTTSCRCCPLGFVLTTQNASCLYVTVKHCCFPPHHYRQHEKPKEWKPTAWETVINFHASNAI